MADNNSAMRTALARLAGNVMSRTFTSSITIGTAATAIACTLAELDEMDKLEIAGHERVRVQAVTVLFSDLSGISFTEDTEVELDGDSNWAIRRWKDAQDGATRTFILYTAE